MFATALITFREALEAALIISIVMVAARGAPRLIHWVSLGVAGGIGLAVVVAMFAGSISSAFAGTGQEVFNASVLFAAVVMLTWHLVWMQQHGKALAAKMKSVGQSIAQGERPFYIVSVVIGLAVLREGSELVLFFHGMLAGQGSSAAGLATGGVLGLGVAVIIAVSLYYGLTKIPMKYFFTVTNWLILLLAAGLAANGAKYLVQADILPALGTALWDTSAWLSEQSAIGQLLHALVGYVARPDGIQLLVYMSTIGCILLLMMVVNRRQPASA